MGRRHPNPSPRVTHAPSPTGTRRAGTVIDQNRADTSSLVIQGGAFLANTCRCITSGIQNFMKKIGAEPPSPATTLSDTFAFGWTPDCIGVCLGQSQ
jgi:hypothetical protein